MTRRNSAISARSASSSACASTVLSPSPAPESEAAARDDQSYAALSTSGKTPKRGTTTWTIALLAALAFSGSAIAAAPVSPTPGVILATRTPTFQITLGDLEAADEVIIQTSSGQDAGLCKFASPPGGYKMDMIASCTLLVPLADGSYTWRYVYTVNSRLTAQNGGTFTVAATVPTTTAEVTTTSPASSVKPLLVPHGKARLKVTSHVCAGKTCAGRAGTRLLLYRLKQGRPVFVRWLP